VPPLDLPNGPYKDKESCRNGEVINHNVLKVELKNDAGEWVEV